MCSTSYDTHSSSEARHLLLSSTGFYQSLEEKDSSDKVGICEKKTLQDHFEVLKKQIRNPSSSFVHTPPSIEQKIDMAIEGFASGHVFFLERQTTRKLHALSHSGRHICHCNYLHKQDLRSISPLPRRVVQGSLALLLQLCFHKLSPAAERYWDGIRGFRDGL